MNARTRSGTIPRHLRNVSLDESVDLGYLQDRYGRKSTTTPLIIAGVLVGAPFLGWVIWAAFLHANQDLTWTTTGFSNVSNTSVTVSFDVFKPESQSAECLVRALDTTGIEVGRAEVPVRGQTGNVHLDYDLAVTARPSSAFVASCELIPTS